MIAGGCQLMLLSHATRTNVFPKNLISNDAAAKCCHAGELKEVEKEREIERERTACKRNAKRTEHDDA